MIRQSCLKLLWKNEHINAKKNTKILNAFNFLPIDLFLALQQERHGYANTVRTPILFSNFWKWLKNENITPLRMRISSSLKPSLSPISAYPSWPHDSPGIWNSNKAYIKSIQRLYNFSFSYNVFLSPERKKTLRNVLGKGNFNLINVHFEQG